MSTLPSLFQGVLKFKSPDQTGIFSSLTRIFSDLDCNIITVDQHSTDHSCGSTLGEFYLRLSFCFDKLNKPLLEHKIEEFSNRFQGHFNLAYSDNHKKMGLLVSQNDHCVLDICQAWKSGELKVDIPFILSNHETVQPIADAFGIPFIYIATETLRTSDHALLSVVADTDFLVLARYMQILSPQFLKTYNRNIINIHHSFLPSFKGAAPYQQAYDRGVKIIGATAHYVTEELDEGPIITQEVLHTTYRDTPESLKQKGKIIEKAALLKAVKLHVEDRVFISKNRTIVFA